MFKVVAEMLEPSSAVVITEKVPMPGKRRILDDDSEHERDDAAKRPKPITFGSVTSVAT